jgi:hypothetical protein
MVTKSPQLPFFKGGSFEGFQPVGRESVAHPALLMVPKLSLEPEMVRRASPIYLGTGWKARATKEN